MEENNNQNIETNNTEVKETKVKSNKGLYVIIIVLCLLLLGSGGYIVVDKTIINKKEANPNTTTTAQTTTTTTQTTGVTNKEYNVGDEITFNNEKWHVISESKASDDYVVVLKDQDITDLKQKAYYECPKEDDNGINCNNKLSNDYNKSVAKKYFDEKYINELDKKNLKEVNGYYIRLITTNELGELGCNLRKISNYGNNACENAPTWLTSNIVSWTMTSTGNENNVAVYGFGYDSYEDTNGISAYGVGSTLSVRPVINLLKSSIE